MLTPTTTIANALNQNQISHHHQHHLGQHHLHQAHHGDEDHQSSQPGLGLSSGGATNQAVGHCATAKLANNTPPQIAISAAGFPSVPHLSSHQDQLQPHLRQSQSQSHLSHHRANNQTHLQQQQQLNNGCNQPNLLDYYPEAQQDGLNLSWFHGANSRQALVRALASERAIVTGDISLAELSRYPVPIMARPPLGVSDLTLENWLTDVIQARKGIKLTFTSTRTVEPAFRVLARHAEHLKGPIILSADILARPVAGSGASGKLSGASAAAASKQQQQQQQQPVDAWTFLMLCRTRFPKSIISIGWCPAATGAISSQQPQISAIEPIVQQADSSTAAESMFELDMMLDHQQQPSTGGGGHHFSQPLLHLSPAAFNQRSSLGSLSVVQQLAAVAAAAGANNHNHDQANYGGGHHHHRLGAPTNGAGSANQMHPANRTPQHNYILSSTGSLNSSSGNSSGSPSPTSPIGHHLLMSPAHQQQLQQQQAQLISQHHHQQLQRHFHQMHQGHQQQQHHHYLHHQSSSAEQLMLAAAAAAAAAASENNNNKSNSSLASIKAQQQHQSNQQQQQQVVGWPAVAAMVAASASFKHEDEETEERINERDHDDEVEDEPEDEDEDDDDDGQLPLNLNINEADPQHASSTLNELAQKIKSLQQESNDLNSITSSLSGGQPTVAFSLASKLFAVGNHLSMGPSGDQGKWEHISKKAALANRLNSNSPSPVSTSPKHQQQHGHHQNNLLCVKATTSLANLAAAQQHQHQQHQHKLVVKQEPRQQPQQMQMQMQSGNQHHHHNNQQQLGYTREMIDKMASLVKEYNLTQPITFPVEARLLGRNNNSLAELQRLLYQVGTNSTLTIVAQPEDLISVDDLLTIRKHFATNQILFDLPDELTASLRHELELL